MTGLLVASRGDAIGSSPTGLAEAMPVGTVVGLSAEDTGVLEGADDSGNGDDEGNGVGEVTGASDGSGPTGATVGAAAGLTVAVEATGASVLPPSPEEEGRDVGEGDGGGDGDWVVDVGDGDGGGD